MKKIYLIMITAFLLLCNIVSASVEQDAYFMSFIQVEIISKDISNNPKNAEAYEKRGLLYLKYLHKLDSAIADFNKAIEYNPKNYKNYTFRGFAKLLLNDNNGALFDANKAIEISERNSVPYADAYLLRALVYINNANTYENSKSDFNKAVEIIEKSNNPYLADEYTYYARGNLFYNLNKKQEALNDYTRAINIYNLKNEINSMYSIFTELDGKVSFSTLCNISDVYKARGIIKIDIQDYDGALSDTSKAIEIDEKNEQPDPEAYLTRGTIYMKMNNPRKAIEDITQSIKINPNDIRAYAVRGIIELELAKEEKSIKFMDSAIDDFAIVNNKCLEINDAKSCKQALKKYKHAKKQRKLLDKELKR